LGRKKRGFDVRGSGIGLREGPGSEVMGAGRERRVLGGKGTWERF